MTANQWLQLVELLSAIGFWALIIRKILNPYPCQCGASFWFFHRYKEHVLMKHGVS